MGCSSSVHAAPPTSQAANTGDKPQPVTADSRLLRGQAYYTAGKIAEALKEFNATIATWPTYARAYLERGNVRLDQKDYPLAVGDYTMALQLQNNLLQAYVMRCHARMALRQWAEALQDVREAERLDPENAQVRALKLQVRKSSAAAGGGIGGLAVPGGGSSVGGDDEDAFAGVDTPKGTPSPSVRKLCMVCMDSERECRLRPCMHAALCVECAEGLMARGYGCPICSCKIEQVEQGAFMRTFTVEEAQGLAASARIGNAISNGSAPSPGKSPLGRRFAPPGATGAPSLDNIVEVDEEAHAAADAAAAVVAAGASAATLTVLPSRLSDMPLPSPPVQLEPHPLAARSATAAAVAARSIATALENAAEVEAEAGSGAGTNRSDVAAVAQASLPGTVEEAGTETTTAEATRCVSLARSVSGADNAAGASSLAAAGSGDLGAGVLSPGTSAHLANSLADWMETHNGAGGGEPAAAGSSSQQPRQQRRTGSNSTLAPCPEGDAEGGDGRAAGSGDVGGSGARRRGDSFGGFAAAPEPAGTAAAAAAGPVAEGRHVLLEHGGDACSSSGREWVGVEPQTVAGFGRQRSARALAAGSVCGVASRILEVQRAAEGMGHPMQGGRRDVVHDAGSGRGVVVLRGGWCGSDAMVTTMVAVLATVVVGERGR